MALRFDSAMQDEQRKIAFEILYAEHATPVYRFALRLCGSREDAEDLAAEALGKAFSNMHKFRGDSSPRTWMCSIVLNSWRMKCRARKVDEISLDQVDTLASTLKSRDPDLADAIWGLPDQLREAFLLVKGEGFTHQEAARVAKVPVGTMYSRVYHAVRQLRERLGPSMANQESFDEVKTRHEM